MGKHGKILVGGVSNIIFPKKTGMSSFPLTKSIIFQDGHIAPPTRFVNINWPGSNATSPNRNQELTWFITPRWASFG